MSPNYRVDLETILTHTIQLKMKTKKKPSHRFYHRTPVSLLIGMTFNATHDEKENAYLFANPIIVITNAQHTVNREMHFKLTHT